MKQRLFAELGIFIVPSLVLALVSYLHPISLPDVAALAGLHPVATSITSVAPMKAPTAEKPIYSQHARPTHHSEKKLESAPVEVSKPIPVAPTWTIFAAIRRGFSLPAFCFSLAVSTFVGVLVGIYLSERNRSMPWILGLIFMVPACTAALFFWSRKGGVWGVSVVGLFLPLIGILLEMAGAVLGVFLGFFVFAALCMFVLSAMGSNNRILVNGRWYRAE